MKKKKQASGLVRNQNTLNSKKKDLVSHVYKRSNHDCRENARKQLYVGFNRDSLIQILCRREEQKEKRSDLLFFSSPFSRRKGKRAEIKGWHDHRPPNVAYLLSNVFPGGGVCCRRVLPFQRHHRAGLRYCGVGKFFMRTIFSFSICSL